VHWGSNEDPAWTRITGNAVGQAAAGSLEPGTTVDEVRGSVVLKPPLYNHVEAEAVTVLYMQTHAGEWTGSSP